jgi:hypothetical protein
MMAGKACNDRRLSDGKQATLHYRSGEIIIRVAPDPVFSRLDRTNQRMSGFAVMACSVLVFRGIAAAYVSAGKTHAQMYPRVAGFHAVFTNAFFCFEDFGLVDMRAFLCHGRSFLSVVSRFAF